jgi:hypothetical protein
VWERASPLPAGEKPVIELDENKMPLEVNGNDPLHIEMLQTDKTSEEED